MEFKFKLTEGRARRLAALAIALDEGEIITPVIECEFAERFNSECARHDVATTTTVCFAAQENWLTHDLDVILCIRAGAKGRVQAKADQEAARRGARYGAQAVMNR